MSHCIVSALLLRAGMAQPGTLLPVQHVCCQISLLFDNMPCELRAFAKLVAYGFLYIDQLPLL